MFLDILFIHIRITFSCMNSIFTEFDRFGFYLNERNKEVSTLGYFIFSWTQND